MEFNDTMDQAFVIRPAHLGDLEWFHSISHMLGTGFTSLQHDREYLQKRLTVVEKSFKEQIPIHERVYLFVRENLPQREIVGISGIDVDVGHKESFYNYQISTITQSSKKINIYMVHTILNVVNNFQQASELISFWVHPLYRGKSVSKSLSLGRFLFMAKFLQWFGKEIISEIRGVVDENGISPFWDAIGKNFFGMEFKRADALTMTAGKQFIADLVSREPIYLDLLPISAQQVVGLEHPEAKNARYLLETQGFKFNNHIDIFDGGPLLSVERDNIKTIANNRLVTISKLQDKITNGVEALLYNNKLDARITVDHIQVLDSGDIVISSRIAEILELNIGDQVRYCLI